MEKIEPHEALDKILEYLVEHKDINKHIDSKEIWENLYPSIPQEQGSFLMHDLVGTIDEIVSARIVNDRKNNFRALFKATSITERFLAQGGFTSLAERDRLANEETKRLKRLETLKLESELDIIKFQKGLGKKLTLWGFAFAVLSVLASILTTLIQNQPDEVLNRKIESLTHRVDSLNANLKSTNLRLQKVEGKIFQETTKSN